MYVYIMYVCQATLPSDISLFNGSYADLLIIVLHKLIVSGKIIIYDDNDDVLGVVIIE